MATSEATREAIKALIDAGASAVRMGDDSILYTLPRASYLLDRNGNLRKIAEGR